MTSRTEIAVIRSQLALRQDTLTHEWEVYTTLHGSGVFRWFKLSESQARWYMKTFPEIKIEYINIPSMITGGDLHVRIGKA